VENPLARNDVLWEPYQSDGTASSYSMKIYAQAARHVLRPVLLERFNTIQKRMSSGHVISASIE
jgi:hypothetical protein